MPRADSVSGTLNYNLHSLTKISLDSIIKKEDIDQFKEDAIAAINADINAPDKNEDIRCSAQEPLDFYFDETGITVFYQTTVNGFMPCRGEQHIDNAELEKKLQSWAK